MEKRVRTEQGIHTVKRVFQSKRIQAGFFDGCLLSSLPFCRTDLAQRVTHCNLAVDVAYVTREIYICLSELGMRTG